MYDVANPESLSHLEDWPWSQDISFTKDLRI